MAELEKEEKEKDWYYAQLQNLTKRIDSLPLTENVSLYQESIKYNIIWFNTHGFQYWPKYSWLNFNDAVYTMLVQFSLQTDMTRRQLEYEARQIRAAMEEQLGTCQDMEKRAQVSHRGGRFLYFDEFNNLRFLSYL